MHTTFIPVLILMASIVLLWSARLFVISPLYWLLGLSKGEKASPFKVTKGVLGMWAAAFGLLADSSWWLAETLPKDASKPPTPQIVKQPHP